MSDARPTSDTVLSPRAGVAVLTLQLRAAVQQAETAEAEAAAADPVAACAELRSRLEPMLAERRRALTEALAEAQAKAAAAVAAAQRAADVMVARAVAPIGYPKRPLT